MKSPLPGVNVMLIGGSGSGKTTAIKTLITKGITPFCIFTEPGMEVLSDIPAKELHWKYIRPATQSFQSMIEMAKNVNTLSFAQLASLQDPNRKQYSQLIDFYTSLNNFTCDRTGEVFGNCTDWGTDKALVIDGLSGVSIMAMNLVVGARPVKAQGEWAIAMDNIARLMQKLCTDTWCHFILMTHAERETDDIGGGSKVMAATLGKKLAPTLPRNFSDVILADRIGTKFTWSTAASGADLKGRNLPVADGLAPDFGPLIDNWLKQGGIISPDMK